MEEIGDTGALKVALPWLHAELEETRETMGFDYCPSDIKDRQKMLETMVKPYEQKLNRLQIDLKVCFAKRRSNTTRSKSSGQSRGEDNLTSHRPMFQIVHRIV